MQRIPYVSIEVTELGDEEVAENFLGHSITLDEEQRKNRDGVIIAPSSFLRVTRCGTKVVKFFNATIDAETLNYMLRQEHIHGRRATNLIAGRILLTAEQGEEPSGMLEGLFD